MARKKQRKLLWDKEEGEEKGGQMKTKVQQKSKKDILWARFKRSKKEEEHLEKTCRGKRRQMSQQRKRRLAQILKKKRPPTDEESTESDCSSEEDRPIRKRLNRIDSDDENDDEDEGEGGGQKSRNSPAAVRGSKDKSDSDSQETDRRYSFCPANGHWTSGVPLRPGARGLSETGNGGVLWRQSVLSGPIKPLEETNEAKSHASILNSVQNIIPT